MTAPTLLNPVTSLWTGAYPLNLSYSYDATGAKTLVIAFVIVNKRTFDPVCEFDGVAATLINHTDTVGDNGTIWLWRLDNPTQGTANVTIVSMSEYGPDGCLFVVGADYSYTIADIIGDFDVVQGTGSLTNTANVTAIGEDSQTVAISTSHYGMALSVSGTPSPTLLSSQSSSPIRAAMHMQQLGATAGSTGQVSNTINTAGFVALVEIVGGTGVQNITAGPMALALEFGPGTLAIAGPQNIAAGPMELQVTFGPGYISTGIYPIILNPTHTITVTLQFTPSVLGSRPATLRVQSNAVGSPHLIPLTGTGSSSPATITYLHTDGNQIVDADGNNTRLVSCSWYGFEQVMMPGGCWDAPYKTVTVASVEHEGVLDRIKRLGFNSIRLPVCIDLTWVDAISSQTDGLDATLNPDLYSGGTTPADRLPPIEMLDKVVEYCGAIGLRIILDMHCLAPNPNNVEGTQGKWYSTATPGATGGTTTGQVGQPRNEAQWIAAWVFYATRYAGNPTVCGLDLVNEPHNCTWDNNANTGWPAAAERCAAAVQAVNSDVLFMIEGVYSVLSFAGGYSYGVFWGEDLSGAGARPVTTPIPNRVVYSPHDYCSYPFFGGDDQIFNRSLSNPLLYVDWLRTCWGYLFEGNLAPIWIGEYGSYFVGGSDGGAYTAHNAEMDAVWIDVLTKYGNGDFDLDTVSELPVGKLGVSSSYWVYNAENSGNASIMQSDHVTVNTFVLTEIAGMMTGA